MSSSSASIPNLARSGTNEIFVQSSPLALSLIDGLPQISMLSFHTCLYRLPDPDDAVSTVNSVEKMFASFAPYPLRPPVVSERESSKLLPVSSVPNSISGTYMPSAPGPSYRSIGSPRPLLRTESAPAATSMLTSTRVVPAGSRCRLSIALTRISSKILYSAGTNVASRRTMRPRARSSTHMWRVTGVIEPT